MPSYTNCRTWKAGMISSSIVVTAPRPPSPATMPAKSGESVSRRISSPDAVTSSSARTAAGRFWLASPEPCVAVAHEPATEICGSEAMLRTAYPALFSCWASSP